MFSRFLAFMNFVLGNLAVCASLILITRQRARALAERAASQENLAGTVSSNEWPAPPPPISESRRPLFRSFLRSLTFPRFKSS